ncbi:hypothetical protein FQA39_LY00064 [Lamprigera yunnana]|nr:hypothetical protein FQA39_LY00064 [Lamprigera yunnana]
MIVGDRKVSSFFDVGLDLDGCVTLVIRNVNFRNIWPYLITTSGLVIKEAKFVRDLDEIRGFEEIYIGNRGLREASVHAATALGAVNLYYYFWRGYGNSGDTAPNVSVMHGRQCVGIT